MDKSKQPLIDHISDFLEYCDLEKGLSESTIINYDRFLDKFRKWLNLNKLNHLKPNQLTADHIWDYRRYLTKNQLNQQTLKKSTQTYYLIALRSLLNYLTSRDISTLHLDKVKLPKLTTSAKQKIKFLNLDQISRLLNAPDLTQTSGYRDKAILETLFSTGLRVSELTALNRDQIQEKTLKTKGLLDLEISIVGKGSRQRSVYFSSRCLKSLLAYLKTRTDNDPSLFINYWSKQLDVSRRLSARSVENIVAKWRRLSGLPDYVTPHTLRHSFATDLLNNEVDIRLIQKFLGHKNLVTTEIYTHVTDQKLKQTHRQAHSGNKLDHSTN